MRGRDRRRCTLSRAPEFRDVAPAFDPSGNYLYFLSYRAFDPVYDSLYFDLGFPKAVRPYLVTLRADLPSPFLRRAAAASGAGRGRRRRGAKDNGATHATAGAEVRIDLDGIERPHPAVPRARGRATRRSPASRARCCSCSLARRGQPRRATGRRAAARAEGHARGLGPGRAQARHARSTGCRRSSRLSATDRRSCTRRQPAAGGEGGREAADGADDERPGRKSGWVDLDRVRVAVDPGEEWRQMFREAWRLQRDHFWVEDMSGVDWDEVRDRYLPLVDQVATPGASSPTCMWEMQGELGTSHAYEMGGDYRRAAAVRHGLPRRRPL